MKFPDLSPKLAEEVGWHIGDGSMNLYNGKGLYQLRGHIEDDKLHYLERIKPLFEELYGIKINLREMPSTRVFGFQVWNNDLIKFKQGIGLPLGKKLNIGIPKIFLNNKFITFVIRGIFDTDGGIYLEKKNNNLYPRLEIRTISIILSKQLLDFMKKIGFRVTRHSELFNKDVKRHRVYVLSIRGVEMFNKFMNIIGPANPKHVRKYNLFLSSKNFK